RRVMWWDRKHCLIFHSGQMGPGPPTPHSITVWTKATWGPPIREHRQSVKGARLCFPLREPEVFGKYFRVSDAQEHH
ncbi:unnamed protein product, partial [Arctogadus glacialis]